MEKEFFYMGRTTMTLEGAIRRIDTFEEFEEKFSEDFLSEDLRLQDYLLGLVSKYDMPLTTISGEAGCNEGYLGLLINGKRKNPSRDVLISLCLAMGTTIEEVQQLLKFAGHAPLYVRRKRDVIIWFAFNKKISARTVDHLLEGRNLPVLTNERKEDLKREKKEKEQNG